MKDIFKIPIKCTIKNPIFERLLKNSVLIAHIPGLTVTNDISVVRTDIYKDIAVFMIRQAFYKCPEEPWDNFILFFSSPSPCLSLHTEHSVLHPEREAFSMKAKSYGGKT